MADVGRSGRFGPSAHLTPANAITALRMLATPVVLVLIVRLGASWATAALWLALASTDVLDGWVARRQGATTSGAFLDPLADKVLVLGALFALVGVGFAWWLPVALLTGREVGVSWLRSTLSRRGVSVPARPLAKAKTLAEDVAVGLFLMPVTGLHDKWAGEWVLWGSVVLALLSGVQYLTAARARVGGPVSAAVTGTVSGAVTGAVTGAVNATVTGSVIPAGGAGAGSAGGLTSAPTSPYSEGPGG